MNSSISPLQDITNADSERYGGKGASLGELAHIGVCVPDAFVISTDINAEMLLENEEEILLTLSSVNS
jgi:phosphoenolpyruvate synthase/pyruvate phosphate dikinase